MAGHLGDERPSGLVGRAREMERLEHLVDQLCDGHGRIAFVSGEAGIGKTSLVETALAAAARRGALTVSGGCYDLTTTPPYGPWRELARAYGARPEAAAGSPQPPAALLDDVSGENLRGQADLFERVAAFLAEIAAAHPVAVALEDLHWADEFSIALLRHVARRCSGAPLLILATYREAGGAPPSAIELTASLIARETRAEWLRLHPLGRREIGALVAARYRLDGDGQMRLAGYLERVAQGNPLFTVEMLRSLEEDRLIEPASDGSWQLGDLDEAQVPRPLQALIEARIRGLPQAVAGAMRTAAVIGQEVDLGLWRGVLGISEAEILGAVELATTEGLVEPLPGGTAMRFRHALVHRAAYQSILPPRRRLLHRAIAEALESSAQADPDRVAWHYRQAGDPRAGGWLILAAERAQRAYAWSAAAERLVTAANLMHDEEPATLGWLSYRIGRLRRHADPFDAGRWLEEAGRLGAAAGDTVLAAFARFDQGHVQVLAGDYSGGIAMMLEGDTLLDALDLDRLDGEVAAWIADSLPARGTAVGRTGSRPHLTAGASRRGTLVQWLVEAGRFAEARRLGEPYAVEPHELANRNDQEISAQGDAWFGLGRIHAWMGAPDAAREALERALECYRRIDHRLLVAATLRVILEEVLIPYRTDRVDERERIRAASEDAHRRATGATDESLVAGFASLEAMTLSGQWSDAVGLLEDALPGGGIIIWRHRAAALLARLERERGNPDEAWRLIGTVLPDGPETRPGTTTFLRAVELQLLAVDLALDAGDLDGAERWLDALEGWLEWSCAIRGRAAALLARASWLAERGDYEDALQLTAQALKAARSPRQPIVELAALRQQGMQHTEVGRHEQAREDLHQALAIAEPCGARYEIALINLELARALGEDGEQSPARALLERTRDELESIGAERALALVRERLHEIADDARDRPAPFGLSKREIEVLELVSVGMTDAEVAEQLSISYRTVTTHLTSIFTKLGVNSRVAATRIAVEQGIV